MITITLRKCLSEPNRLTKTFVASDDKTVQGNFKEPEDLLKPIIQIQTAYDLSKYNYCEIPAFGRKYFMTVKADYRNIWTLTCDVDVLSTYATEIKACDAIVKRSQNKINFYINDGAFFTEQRQVITYQTFKKNGTPATLGDESYYLLVAGG